MASGILLLAQQHGSLSSFSHFGVPYKSSGPGLMLSNEKRQRHTMLVDDVSFLTTQNMSQVRCSRANHLATARDVPWESIIREPLFGRPLALSNSSCLVGKNPKRSKTKMINFLSLTQLLGSLEKEGGDHCSSFVLCRKHDRTEKSHRTGRTHHFLRQDLCIIFYQDTTTTTTVVSSLAQHVMPLDRFSHSRDTFQPNA